MSSPRPGASSHPPPSYVDGPALLERAVGYTRGCLQLVPGEPLDSRTPCAGWDLLSLLQHMDDSLAAFADAAEIGYVDLVPVRADDPGPEGATLLLDRLKGRACAVLGGWAHAAGTRDVAVSDRILRSDLLAAAGALEIAVHGWDVAQACGVDRRLPPGLALDLLDLVPLLVDDADRPARFAAPVVVPLHSRPSTRLLAAVGRRA